MNIFKKIEVWLSGPKIVKAVRTGMDLNNSRIKCYFDDGSESSFIGSGTVWREEPFMETDHGLDAHLYSIDEYINTYGNPYPTAHEKPSRSNRRANGELLRFIYNRMVRIHKENPSYDYMLHLDAICKEFEENENA